MIVYGHALPLLEPGALFDLPYIKGDFEDKPFRQVFGHWCCLNFLRNVEFAATIATAIFNNITFMPHTKIRDV